MRKFLQFGAPGLAAILLVNTHVSLMAQAGAAQVRKPASSSAWADSVRNAPHFLVRLEQELNTGKNKNRETFEVRTIEPLVASNGHALPAGTKIVGHISRIEPG